MGPWRESFQRSASGGDRDAGRVETGVGHGDSAAAMLDERRASRRRPIPPKLYRIGEIVDYAGVSRQTIHNYTTMGLLHESQWTRGGHRLYDESVFDRLDQVIEMKRRNKSMREIREHFSRLDESSQ